ncbi:MAG: hypothetical protein GY716_00665 [bacterium]|nr:hypothetical protein [bacterium]
MGKELNDADLANVSGAGDAIDLGPTSGLPNHDKNLVDPIPPVTDPNPPRQKPTADAPGGDIVDLAD